MVRERKSTNRAGAAAAARGVKITSKRQFYSAWQISTAEARAPRGAKAELLRGVLLVNLRQPNFAAKPLYDTGKYLASITHVVRDKDADSFDVTDVSFLTPIFATSTCG